MKCIHVVLLMIIQISYSCAQGNMTYLVTKTTCDTCKNKCDTLIYIEYNNYKECLFNYDTLKNVDNDVETPLFGKVLQECSKILTDSARDRKTYLYSYEDGYQNYEEIEEHRRYRIVRSFDADRELRRVDSVRLRNKKVYARFTVSYRNDVPQDSTIVKCRYHLNGKIRRSTVLYESWGTKRINRFNCQGKPKTTKSYQKDSTGDWYLTESSKTQFFGKNHYKEIYINYLDDMVSSYEWYTTDEVSWPSYTRSIKIEECEITMIKRMKF